MILFFLGAAAVVYIFWLPLGLLLIGIRMKLKYADLLTYAIMLAAPPLLIYFFTKILPGKFNPFSGTFSPYLFLFLLMGLLVAMACGMFSTYFFCKRIFFPALKCGKLERTRKSND